MFVIFQTLANSSSNGRFSAKLRIIIARTKDIDDAYVLTLVILVSVPDSLDASQSKK